MIENYGTQSFTHTLIYKSGINLILHSYFDPMLLKLPPFYKELLQYVEELGIQ